MGSVTAVMANQKLPGSIEQTLVQLLSLNYASRVLVISPRQY